MLYKAKTNPKTLKSLHKRTKTRVTLLRVTVVLRNKSSADTRSTSHDRRSATVAVRALSCRARLLSEPPGGGSFQGQPAKNLTIYSFLPLLFY